MGHPVIFLKKLFQEKIDTQTNKKASDEIRMDSTGVG